MMRAYVRLLLVFALTAGAAYLASRALVPNAMPVADNEEPQWYLQLAFVLRSIELIGLGGMVLVLVAGLATWFGGVRGRRGFARSASRSHQERLRTSRRAAEF